MEHKIGLIDLGSNSVRMSIYSIYNDKSFECIKKIRDTVRLSEGMANDNILKENSINRAIASLKNFGVFAQDYGVTYLQAVATSAVRRAINKKDFIIKVENEAKIKLRVLTEQEEAYFGFLGVQSMAETRKHLIIDVGGGSSEITAVINNKLFATISLPYGAVILTEKFKNEKEKMYDYMHEKIEKIPFLKSTKRFEIIALGGSAETASKVLENTKILYDDVKNLYEKIKNTPKDKIANINGISKDRADIILGGLTPILALMNIVSSPKLNIYKTSIRDGIFLDIYERIKNGEEIWVLI